MVDTLWYQHKKKAKRHNTCTLQGGTFFCRGLCFFVASSSPLWYTLCVHILMVIFWLLRWTTTLSSLPLYNLFFLLWSWFQWRYTVSNYRWRALIIRCERVISHEKDRDTVYGKNHPQCCLQKKRSLFFHSCKKGNFSFHQIIGFKVGPTNRQWYTHASHCFYYISNWLTVISFPIYDPCVSCLFPQKKRRKKGNFFFENYFEGNFFILSFFSAKRQTI